MRSDVQAFSPGDLSAEEIKACLALIEEGDAVDIETAAYELPRAMVVAIGRDGPSVDTQNRPLIDTAKPAIN